MFSKWWWRWKLGRIREKLAIAVAGLVPRWLCYRVYVRVAAEVTVKDPQLSKVPVPEIPAMDILQSFRRRDYADAR